MINAIRAIVNWQTIQDSITDVHNQVEETIEHTNYITNFLNPYIESHYASYFFAHENNQLLPGEKIITITTLKSDHDISLAPLTTGNTILASGTTMEIGGETTASQQWNTYLKDLITHVTLR